MESSYPYVFVDGIWLKRGWGRKVQAVSVLVPIGVIAEGYREVLGLAEDPREDGESWRNFLRYLNKRGLAEIRLVVSDKTLRLFGGVVTFRGQMAVSCGSLTAMFSERYPAAKSRTFLDVEGKSFQGRLSGGWQKAVLTY